jgi:DNA repair protein Swi5/Sae3
VAPALPDISPEDKDALLKEANAIIKQHINLLHEYNEIKDVAQGLIGMIADQRGVRVVDCEGEFGVGAGD